MKIQFTIVFLFLFHFGYSQSDKPNLELTERLIRSYQKNGEIIYTEKIFPSLIDKMIDVFKEDTIRSIVKETEGNEIILSAKERREVLKNLKSQKKIIWGDRLFQYSKRIPNDSLIYYSTNSYEEINKTMKFDSTGKLLCLPKYEKYIEKRVFVFTNPILLRNNSIQMIYVLYKCGNNCGHDEIVFYKRLNNEWEKWIICYSGEF